MINLHNKLLFLSGEDVPFPIAQLTIHQPKIKEIALIGEKAFFDGYQLVTFSKEKIQFQGKKDLSAQSNFNIIMSSISDKSLEAQKAKFSFISFLSLLFPDYKISLQFNPNQIIFQKNDEQKKIDEKSYPAFQDTIREVFSCLSQKLKDREYNPGGDLARKIAEKLQKSKQKIEKKTSQNEDISICTLYISILAVGLNKNITDLMNYTIPQLFEEYKRYEMKYRYDVYVSAKLAGAKDVEEVAFWMTDDETK